MRRSEKLENLKNSIIKTPFVLSLIAILIVIFDLGFNQTMTVQKKLDGFYYFIIAVGVISVFLKMIFQQESRRFKVIIFDLFSIAFLSLLFLLRFNIIQKTQFFSDEINHILLYAATFLVFIREFSALKIDLKRAVLNPAQIFILSFLLIIIIGGLLLMLPNATYKGISFIDAMFTSTSAVCVTGLAVVDTGTYFTGFGISVIAILIQVGGLGIMTFASYFSYFFRGGTSYENQLMLSDMSNVEKLGEVFSTLKKIILVTFIIEFIGALLIFANISSTIFPDFLDRCYFSIFHSISGFCNAGFSTLSNSFYEPAFRFNYPLHLILALLFIIGGLGFPIVFNLFKYVKHIIQKRLSFSSGTKALHLPWVINLNTRIVLITSLSLIISGTILFYLFEYNNTLGEHSGFGKIVTSFFGAVTPRTAGFNTVDTSALNFSTLMVIFILMWIGASPASTGGGIKTTTFAIATLNFISLAKGKNRIEIYRREVADISVRRAFAIISLSLMIIGVAIFSIASIERNKDLMSIAFECFSAYSTVGLSVGLTAKLSTASKMILIGVMFIGRVSMLSILIALVKNEKHKNYRYPTEELLIN